MTFFIGCVLAEVYPFLREGQHKILRPVAAVTLVGSGVLLMKYGVEVISGNSSVGFAFLICPLILYLALENKLFSGFLRCKTVMWLGKISVSVYFWHFVIYIYFRYIWQLCSGGTPVGDIQYAGYLVLLIVLSDLATRCFMGSGKPSRKVSQTAPDAVQV